MPVPPEENTPFFSRWSRRKRAAESDDTALTPEPEEAASETPVQPPENESLSEEELAALPSIEDLTPQTDIRPFLQKGVPTALRNAALRKKWMLLPAVRDHVDPAVDYAWDWNVPGGVPGDGLAPSPERAARMLRDLIAPRRDAEDTDPSETGAKSTHTTAPDAPDAAPQQDAPSHDTARSDPPPTQAVADDTSPDEAEAPVSDDAPPMGRKRHGGALPD